MNWTYVAVCVGAYLLGAIPFGWVIYRLRSGRDIRGEGSGNIGATNVTRRAGLKWGLLTLALDFAKGYAAVAIAGLATRHDPYAMAIAAFAAIAGHVFPVYIGFRGGKGVATGAGVFASLAPWSLLVGLAVFTVLLAAFRYVSLGSIVAVAVLPAVMLFLDKPGGPIIAGAVAAAVLIVARHSENIRRLAAGTERKLQLK